MKIENTTHARPDTPSRVRGDFAGEGLILQSFTQELRAAQPMPRSRRRQLDLMKLDAMKPSDIEDVLSKVKRFSEALEYFGVARKNFMRWLEAHPEHMAWMGRKRAYPIWEE